MSECELKILPNDVLMSQAAEFLTSGMDVLLPVKGNSMLPYIHPGKDLVLLRREQEVLEGDVVLALTSAGNYVIHRVIKKEEDGSLTLKGDGNLYGTESCSPEAVFGTVIEVKKASGKVFFPRSVKSWHKLPVLLRRIVLALYKRIVRL